LSIPYQVISSSYVLVPDLQTGIKITSFTLSFYWSFLFKYQALIHGPSPSATFSCHQDTRAQHQPRRRAAAALRACLLLRLLALLEDGFIPVTV